MYELFLPETITSPPHLRRKCMHSYIVVEEEEEEEEAFSTQKEKHSQPSSREDHHSLRSKAARTDKTDSRACLLLLLYGFLNFCVDSCGLLVRE